MNNRENNSFTNALFSEHFLDNFTGLTHGWRHEVPDDIQKRVDDMIKQELGDTDLQFD